MRPFHINNKLLTCKGVLITHLSSWILTCIQVANPPYQITMISLSIPISKSHNFSNVLSTMRS